MRKAGTRNGLNPKWRPSTNQARKFRVSPAHAALITLLSSVTLSLHGDPAQNPKRLLNRYTVDLTPLTKWWSTHQGPRPLTAWIHLTGPVVGTNSGGWLIEAKLERASTADPSTAVPDGLVKILLRNPPLDERIEFENLTSRLRALLRQRAIVAGDEEQARSAEHAVSEQRRARPTGSLGRVLAREDDRLKQTENEAKAHERSLDQQIRDLKLKLASFPSADQYVVDCFAMDLKYEHAGARVYDHGQILNTP